MKNNIIVLEETDSTNLYLKNLISRNPVQFGTTVWAKRQTAGRGRLGRTFCSPEGGIYVSIALPYDSTMTITARAAVAVKRTIKELCKVDTQIKWVNDIYLDNKKICGILAELYNNIVILGIGVNLYTKKESFSSEISYTASSLYDGKSADMPDPAVFVETLIDKVLFACSKKDTLAINEYISSSMLIGKNVDIIKAGKVTNSGQVLSIDQFCALHVMTETGELILTSGEVSVRLNLG